MSKQLEHFMEQNKDAFNDYEPSAKLWNKLQKELDSKPYLEKQQATVKKLVLYKWIAAASVTLLIGLSIVYFIKDKAVIPSTVATNNKVIENKLSGEIYDTTDKYIEPKAQPKNEIFIAKQSIKIVPRKILQKNVSPEKKYDEMLAFEQTQKHFATLISYKAKEIKKLSKTDTAIYNSFSADMEGLNKSYLKLSKALPKTNSKSALINAMIYNLQIQIDLLNKQLIILNKIESSQKKEQYEINI
jgi:hypothetical protein